MLVLQSCPAGEDNGWLADCMQSVRDWSSDQGFEYRWLDDELFSVLPDTLQPGGAITKVIASDLARLEWARHLLRSAQADEVLWLDADVLIFSPARLALPQTDHAVGRENWVQRDETGRWRCHRKVHNAALFFRADADGRNIFLDFYAENAARLLRQNVGRMPPQFIGPKLLTALHNVVQIPVMESVGMISPGLAEDLLGGDNGALSCYQRKSPAPLAAANLCRSSLLNGTLCAADLHALAAALQDPAGRMQGEP